MKRAFLILKIAVPALAIVSSACTKDKTPLPAPPPGQPCDPNKVYFEQSIKPVIISNCAIPGCHDAGTQQDGVNLSSYDGIRREVSAGRPQDSDLYERITDNDPEDRMPPAPRPPLTQEQKDLIRNWIAQGADNATCTQNTGPCNPANVSFAAEIRPILNTNCVGCHSGSTLNGGVDLSTFTGVQAVAQNGKLYNAVSQNGQATPMPPGGKLPDCDIRKIKVWIDEGVNNN